MNPNKMSHFPSSNVSVQAPKLKIPVAKFLEMVASQNLTGKARHSNEVGTLGTPFFYSNAYTEKEGILSVQK